MGAVPRTDAGVGDGDDDGDGNVGGVGDSGVDVPGCKAGKQRQPSTCSGGMTTTHRRSALNGRQTRRGRISSRVHCWLAAQPGGQTGRAGKQVEGQTVEAGEGEDDGGVWEERTESEMAETGAVARCGCEKRRRTMRKRSRVRVLVEAG